MRRGLTQTQKLRISIRRYPPGSAVPCNATVSLRVRYWIGEACGLVRRKLTVGVTLIRIRSILEPHGVLEMKSKDFRINYERLSVYLRCLTHAFMRPGLKPFIASPGPNSSTLTPLKSGRPWAISVSLAYARRLFVEDLREHITMILGLDKPHRVAIVGAGVGDCAGKLRGFRGLILLWWLCS